MDIEASPKLGSRLLRGTATFFGTSIFLAVAGVSVWQGSALLADRAAAVEKPAATQPLVISTSKITRVPSYTVERSFTGQIEAPQIANLSFEQGGTLAEILVDEGDTVSKGQLLAKLDARLLSAEVARLEAAKQALEAQLELATLTDKRQAELKQRGFASAQTADQTRLSISELTARMAEAEAGILAAQIRLEKAEIRAPFGGVVNRRLVDVGNTVGGGQTVVSLIENEVPIFRVGVDPALADQLSPGETISVTIGETEHKADVVGILPQVDPATRTRTVRAQLKEDVNFAFGQTGEAILTQRIAESGAWIPLTAIEDGVRGLWTIKTVNGDAEPIVGIEAVEIIYANSTQAFVRGTFENDVRYIDQGVHRVVAGQTVRVAE